MLITAIIWLPTQMKPINLGLKGIHKVTIIKSIYTNTQYDSGNTHEMLSN